MDLPPSVRSVSEDALGSAVVADASQAGGFSPGLASRLTLADGRRVFVKAISPDRDPRSPGLYRREIEVMGSLPVTAPAPRLRWSYDDGNWVVLILDDVDGVMPTVPWGVGQLAAVLDALERLAVALTPAPARALPIADDLGDHFRSWRRIGADSQLAGRLGGWEREHLADLVAWESGWAEGACGDTLLHADLRADNLLITGSGEVWVVDWPYAVVGAAWVDALLFLVSVAADGGVDVERAWAGFGPARLAVPEAVNAVLAAVAGDFRCQSLLPAPANLPTLRAHQRAKAEAAVGWLRSRLAQPAVR